jgi:methionyl-tRNA formyltransferase
MLMDAGLDTGPVLLERREPIRAEDDAGSLGARLADIGAGLLVETLDGLASGTVQPVPQDEGAATQASKLGSKDRWLEWSASAEELVRRVRALAPDPGATTTFRGKGLKVFRAVREPVEGGPAGGEPAKAEVREAEPGTVISVERDGFLVGTGAGAFRPLEVGPAGRRRMTAAELVHGFHIRPGERMG